jgi:hypothetical protein
MSFIGIPSARLAVSAVVQGHRVTVESERCGQQRSLVLGRVMKKRLVLALVVVCLGMGPLVIYQRTRPSDGVNRLSARRVRPGMSQQEVQAIVGKPSKAPPGRGWVCWTSESGSLTVFFDRDGKATYTSYLSVNPTLIDRLIDWLPE